MNKHVCGELNLIGQTTDVDCLKLERACYICVVAAKNKIK